MTAATQHANEVQANVLSRMWWAVLLRGIAFAVFAFCAFLVVGKTLPALILAFSIFALAEGACSLIGAVRGGGLMARVWLTLAGLVSVACSLVALLPDLTWEAFAKIIGGWALVRGGLELASALSLRRYMERDWSLAFAAGLGLLFGAGVLLAPAIDPWTFVRLLCVYALVTGLLFAVLAFRFAKGFRP